MWINPSIEGSPNLINRPKSTTFVISPLIISPSEYLAAIFCFSASD